MLPWIACVVTSGGREEMPNATPGGSSRSDYSSPLHTKASNTRYLQNIRECQRNGELPKSKED